MNGQWFGKWLFIRTSNDQDIFWPLTWVEWLNTSITNHARISELYVIQKLQQEIHIIIIHQLGKASLKSILVVDMIFFFNSVGSEEDILFLLHVEEKSMACIVSG